MVLFEILLFFEIASDHDFERLQVLRFVVEDSIDVLKGFQSSMNQTTNVVPRPDRRVPMPMSRQHLVLVGPYLFEIIAYYVWIQLAQILAGNFGSILSQETGLKASVSKARSIQTPYLADGLSRKKKALWDLRTLNEIKLDKTIWPTCSWRPPRSQTLRR